MSKAKKAYHKAKGTAKSFFSKETWKGALVCNQRDWGQATAKSLVDMAAGFAGAAGGTFLGWIALPAGLAGNVVANKFGHTWASSMSVGMMTAPVDEAIGASRRSANTGFDIKAEMSEGKERMSNYFGQVYRKFGLHKVFGEKQTDNSSQTTETVNGLGNATIDSLDKYEQQIVSSGIENEGGVPFSRQTAPAESEEPALEAFSMNGLDELNTPHII